MNRGLFICIEGGDGSGKGTQHELLSQRLQEEGISFTAVDFPRYGEPSAELVELYLNNGFGDATKLDARLASVLFAIDRLAAKPDIEQALANGTMVLANRFTASNMAHQGAKLATTEDRKTFFRWLQRLEHDTMGIPQPDHHYVLQLPATIAQRRVLLKTSRSYTDKKLDGHEADLEYQQRAEQTYSDLIATFSDRFTGIPCVEDDVERAPEQIHTTIWNNLRELLR